MISNNPGGSDPVEGGGSQAAPVVSSEQPASGFAGIPKQTLIIIGAVVAVLAVGLLVFFTTR